MTHVCCPSCRLRFTRAAAAHLIACPECGGPTQTMPHAAQTVGFRLALTDDLPGESPIALAIEMPVPDLREPSS
jgi:hypothetical protein